MLKGLFKYSVVTLSVGYISACSAPQEQLSNKNSDQQVTIEQSVRVLLTSESGHKVSEQANLAFKPGAAQHPTQIEVYPGQTKQTMHGVGTSFTESSAFVLAHLTPEKRLEVMKNIYGEQGANFPLARTHIGSTDFSVEGKYAYAETPDDMALTDFTIAADSEGFSPDKYPGVVDPSFDLLPMIQQANQIKRQQGQDDVTIVASAWTAPPWMKDINDWFWSAQQNNSVEGTGGSLKPGYEKIYADYLVKYLDAYQQQGVDIWGLTPVNEPHGNRGQWESMHFSAESQRDFIKNHLGPKLHDSGHGDIKLLAYDQNRDGLEHWADTILGDQETADYVYGTAVHWYESTFKVYEEELEAVHQRFPNHDIIHTEGTIDDLGKPAPVGIADVEGFTESNWFNNDDFWWNQNATDWAYTAEWAPNVEDHPKYTPVHRYARNIIVSFNHWMSGWIDWNIVLDKHGGPNHVGNFCGAPIMIDTDTGEVYYTPIYYVLSQLSQTIRPGDKAVKVELRNDQLPPDTLHASATISPAGLLSVQLLNTSKKPLRFDLAIGKQFAEVNMSANSVQSIQVQL